MKIAYIIAQLVCCFFAVNVHVAGAMASKQELIANQIAKYIVSRYFGNKYEKAPTNIIIDKLGYIVNDSTLKAPVCDLIRDKLAFLLSNKIYSTYVTYHDSGTVHLKYLFFDGTTEIIEKNNKHNRMVVLKPKPRSPWHQLSLEELIKNAVLIQNLKKIGLTYPFDL